MDHIIDNNSDLWTRFAKSPNPSEWTGHWSIKYPSHFIRSIRATSKKHRKQREDSEERYLIVIEIGT